MDKANLYDIGFCFCFDIKVDDNKIKLSDIQDYIYEKRASCIMISDMFGLPFAIGTVTCFVYHTYSRRAYEIYYKFNGRNIRSIDPVAIQCILKAVGVRSASRPEIRLIDSGVIYQKEK